MTDETPRSHDKKNDGSEKSEKHPEIEEQIGLPLRELAQRVEALIDEVRTERETNHRERQDYQEQESDRLRVDTFWNRIFSAFTLLVGALTFLILFKTYGVYSTMSQTYSTQATIMATQAAIMRGQEEITEKTLPPMQSQASAAQTAAGAAMIQAQAAKSAADTARDTLRLTEAPDIEVQYECSTPAFGLETRLTLHYHNAGRTRADDFAQAFSPGIPANRPEINTTESKGPLSAGALISSGTTPTLKEMLHFFSLNVPPEETFQKIRDGKLQFTFWGIATYKDLLQVPHQFEFMYQWDRAWPDKCVFTLVQAKSK